MSELREFSKIIILRDTPETRFAFGPPIDENSIKTANIYAKDSTNPFYTRLVGTGVSMAGGWRWYYPNLDPALEPGTPPTSGSGSDGSGYNLYTDAVRNNFLNAIGTEENNSVGYNRTPATSGTAVIYEDKLYVGSISSVNYDSIDSDGDDVVINGTFSTPIALKTKVILSNTSGISGLSLTTTYYAYAGTGSSFKLASSASNAEDGVGLGLSAGTAGAGTAYLTPNGHEFSVPTTLNMPALSIGDYIFWGEDPNDLNVGGKIAEVYTSGPEFSSGARYRFEKNTNVAFPTFSAGTPYSGDPIAQNIYYYKKGWNGKGMKNNLQIGPNEIGGGFYVLIKCEGDSTIVTYPYLGMDSALVATQNNTTDAQNNSNDRIVQAGTLYAFTDLIRIRRISNRFKSDETDTGVSDEIIPCSIHRTNNFYYGANDINSSNVLTQLFEGSNVGGFPMWVAYYVNPYGGNIGRLEKNTTYVLEVNERLPAVPNFTTGSGTDPFSIYNFASSGAI